MIIPMAFYPTLPTPRHPTPGRSGDWMPAFQERGALVRIGDVARNLGVSTSLIRKAERKGRIPPARRLRIGKEPHGARRYTDEDLERIREAFFGPGGEPDEASPSATVPAPEPAVELVTVALGRQHTINGAPYGPGTVRVPAGLAVDLRANEAKADEGLAHERSNR